MNFKNLSTLWVNPALLMQAWQMSGPLRSVGAYATLARIG